MLEGIIIGGLLAAFGWRPVFIVVGFAALIWLLPWFLATPSQMRDTSSSAERPRFTWNEFKALLRSRDLFGVLLGFFCFDYYWYFLINWLPSYFVNIHGVTIQEAGIRASLPFLVFGVCQPLGGWVADKLVRRGWEQMRARKVIITIAFLSGLSVIPAACIQDKNLSLGLIMVGCFVGLSAANQLVLLQGCTPPKDVGLAVGVYNFVGNLAGKFQPLVTGAVIKLSGGSYTLAFTIAAVMLAASTFSYWFLVGSSRGSPEIGQQKTPP